MDERREHTRYEIAIKAFCKPWKPFDERPPEPIPFQPVVENVSHGGLCLLTDEVLEQGQIVNLVLSITGQMDYIELAGEVAWSRREKGKIRTGIRFLEPSHQQHALETLLHAAANPDNS